MFSRAPPGGRDARRGDSQGGGLTERIARLGISIVLLAADLPAQSLPDSGFQLPGAAGAADAARPGPKSRLLQLIRHRSWPEAARVADGLLLGTVADPELHYLVGVVLWQRQDKVGAIRRFRAAEQLGLRESYLHKALGAAYYDAHQFLLFEQQMERAIAVNRSDPQPHQYLGQYTESVKGDFVGALRHFETVVALDPDHARGHSYLAYCLERLDRRDEAAETYRTSVRLLERDGERFSWPYQGLARLALKADPQAARSWARKAVEVGPDEFETHALLARTHDRNGEPARAVAAASEAVRLNPDHAASHYLLFTAHRKLGNADSAQRHVSRFQELKRVYGDQ